MSPEVGKTRAYRFYADRFYLDRANRDVYLYRDSNGDLKLSGNLAMAALATLDTVDLSELAEGGHVFLFAGGYNSAGQGTWVREVNATYLLGCRLYNSTNADEDNVLYKVYLPKGTWTLRLYYAEDTSHGIVDIDIDGTEVATVDTYASSLGANKVKTQTSISITTSGLKTITVRVDGKNASSSSYYASFSAIELWRTA